MVRVTTRFVETTEPVEEDPVEAACRCNNSSSAAVEEEDSVVAEEDPVAAEEDPVAVAPTPTH